MVDGPIPLVASPWRRNLNPQVGRADLLLALREDLGAADWEAIAQLCGFARRPPEAIPAETPSDEVPAIAARPRKESEEARGEFRLFRAERYRDKNAEPVRDRPPEIGAEPIRMAELRAQPYLRKPEPLQPWSRLWPHLRRVLGRVQPAHAMDVPRLVDDMARLRPIQRLPRRSRLGWAPRVHVLIDGARAMDQFQTDVEVLLDRLRRLRGREGLHCRVLPFGPDDPGSAFNVETWEQEPPAPVASGEPVLVVGDLGCLDGEGYRQLAWRRFGIELRRHGALVYALSPCPRDRWTVPLAAVWNCCAWDRHERPPHDRRGQRPRLPALEPSIRQAMLDALLRACSVLARIEAPLLRDLRLRLPGADVGLEYDVWHHPESASEPTACALRLEKAPERWEELSTATDDLSAMLKRTLPKVLRRHHAGHGKCLWAWETLACWAAGVEVTDDEVEQARTIMGRANRTRLEEIITTAPDFIPPDRYGLGALNQRELARMHPEHRARIPELSAGLALERLAGTVSAMLPDGIDLDAYWRTIRYAGETPKVDVLWRVRHCDPELELRPAAIEWSALGGGNPLALLSTQSRELTADIVSDTQTTRTSLRLTTSPAPTCQTLKVRTIRLHSERGELDLAANEPPPWATRFGWDRFGLFADFEVRGVTFPLRWIPPGEFVMGSPEDEPGRWNDESPQHRVTVGRGFWLGETPVTQGQYAAVTGQRPAMFQHAGDQAPVEQVSWDDCREFCGKLKKEVANLDRDSAFRLPTEAEWEYACRAGTAGALYTGPLTILGERNGPELDAIAWYGGNSGVDYEGGYDSSDWKEKQYKHKRAGTHPVRQKAPNAWGLYDMLGNVWEWCEDDWHGDYKGAPTDGSAWKGEGTRRVYRGGSWAYVARRCRCAFRDRWEPGFRNGYLGFRLVLAVMVKEGIRPFS